MSACFDEITNLCDFSRVLVGLNANAAKLVLKRERLRKGNAFNVMPTTRYKLVDHAGLRALSFAELSPDRSLSPRPVVSSMLCFRGLQTFSHTTRRVVTILVLLLVLRMFLHILFGLTCANESVYRQVLVRKS